jgi:hypothetical protein
MKIFPCKYIFCKPEKMPCIHCVEFWNNQYCYGILYIFIKLRYLPGKIINYIKNILNKENFPF